MATFTGAFERVGNITSFGVGATNPSGLAWDGTTLFMVDERTDILFSLNRTNGGATRIGAARRFGRVDEQEPKGLAWDGTTLWMVGSHNARLYSLDRTTGVATAIENSGFGSVREFDPTGLAWDGTTLWMVGRTNERLYKVDRTTGNATIVGPARLGLTDLQNLSGLAWDGEQLLMVGGSPNALFVIDRTSGRATRIGEVDNFGDIGESTPKGLAWDGTDLFMTGASRDYLSKAVQPPSPPDTPSNLSLTVVDHETITATCDAVTDATFYEWKIATSEAGLASASYVRTTARTNTFDNLSPSTEYFITVRSGNDIGTSDDATAQSATTQDPPPPPVPTYSAPAQPQAAAEGGQWSIDLATLFTDATTYAFQSGYTPPPYLTLVGSLLSIAEIPAVTQDTTLNILVEGTNVSGTTPGTVSLLISNVPLPPSATGSFPTRISLSQNKFFSRNLASDVVSEGTGLTFTVKDGSSLPSGVRLSTAGVLSGASSEVTTRDVVIVIMDSLGSIEQTISFSVSVGSIFDLSLSDMPLADLMKEQISIRRESDDYDYDPTDSDTYTELATDVDAVFTQPLTPQSILPTGVVIDEPDYRCRLFIPVPGIQNGDLVLRGQSLLFVESVSHPNNTNIMTLGLQRQQ